MQIAAQHAVEAHGLTVDDGLVAAVKGAIRDKSRRDEAGHCAVMEARGVALGLVSDSGDHRHGRPSLSQPRAA